VEGAEPQPGHWPAVTAPTPPAQMVARGGNGLPMRESFLKRGLARAKPGLPRDGGSEGEPEELTEQIGIG